MNVIKQSIVFCVLQSLICFYSTQRAVKARIHRDDITLTDANPVQYIQSPGFPTKPYPQNYNIQYDVTIKLSDPVEQRVARISIKFEYLSIESSDNCKDDSLQVIFPRGESRMFCGVHPGKTIVSEFNSAAIHFSSNNNIRGNKGFRIRLEVIRSQCSYRYINLRKGTIRTPNYPMEYRRDETCIWHITVDKGKFIKLTFKDFNINTSSQVCSEDYLLVSRTGDLDTDVRRFCGNKKPNAIISHSNTMLIKFNSNCCDNGKGFMAIFTEHYKPEPTPERLPMLTPDNCPCGKENERALRIVGGTEVTPLHRYPWMASIVTSSNSPFCGGVLINNLFIMTAAHCMVDETADEIRVRVGQHSLLESTPMLNVSEIIMHSNYNNVSQFNDIALIRLKNPVKYNRNIFPACLPASDLEDPDGLFVAGWGRLNEGGNSSDRLHQITLPQYSSAKCEAQYNGLVNQNHLCAGGVKGQDACQGDSGGPLTTRINNRVNVVGVVSWGLGCARDTPGVYTRVTSYLKWIEENTRDGTYCPPKKTKIKLIKWLDEPIQPNFYDCGLPNFKSTKRIAGVAKAIPQEFPWTVVLECNGKLIGGGSLIVSNLVLTSAQKLKQIFHSCHPSNIKIIVRTHDITKSKTTKLTYGAKKILFHPQFGVSSPLNFDFALIELKPTLKGFLPTNPPVCLVRSDTLYVVRKPCIAAGWGLTSTRNPGSPVLRKVTLQFTDRRQCTKTFKNYFTDSMICTMAENKNVTYKDLCIGDGGGPLMKYFNGRMYLIGIMSWFSPKGCAFGKPSVFADVRYALPWITSVTGIETA